MLTFISVKKYIGELLYIFDMQDINFVSTPKEKYIKISSSVGNTLGKATKYMTHYNFDLPHQS